MVSIKETKDRRDGVGKDYGNFRQDIQEELLRR